MRVCPGVERSREIRDPLQESQPAVDEAFLQRHGVRERRRVLRDVRCRRMTEYGSSQTRSRKILLVRHSEQNGYRDEIQAHREDLDGQMV